MWLRRGSTLEAARASIALPGLFAPARREGEPMVDGGLANPIPVSLARAMGADIVIAVDLGSGILGRRFCAAPTLEAPTSTFAEWMHRLHESFSARAPGKSPEEPEMPSMRVAHSLVLLG